MTPDAPATPEAPTGRAPRGRVLVVGPLDGPLDDPPRGRLRSAPIRVGTIFDAIGEIAAATVDRPIVATFVDGRLLSAGDHRAAAAMRRLDPSVRLVHVVDPSGAPGPRAIEGFDDRVEGPIDLDALRRILGEAWLLAPEAVATRPPSASSNGPTRKAPTANAATPPNAERTATPRRSGEPLGDTDLVSAVLHDPEGVTSAAIALVREHTGWSDVRLVTDDAATPAGGVPVSFGDTTFGHLASDEAKESDLGAWARWLGHWLALDRSYRDHRVLAYRDDLTGTWNRRYFNRFMNHLIEHARARRRPATVLLFDIDDFKRYNDTYGHEAGDVILRETVALLNSVIRTSDCVCRVGGDEFAVIFADDAPRETGSRHPESVETIARRFQQQISSMRFPKLGLEAPGALSISGGLATYPWDGQDAQTLLRHADERLLESKRKGKNIITFGPDAADG